MSSFVSPSEGISALSIRDVARAAWEASQSDRVAAARAVLTGLLGDPNGEFSSMQLVEVQAPPTVPYTLVVLADDDSDVHLGVRQEKDATTWQVFLVADQNGWTILGKQVQSLEHLYLLIVEYLPEPGGEEYPAWVQPTGAHDAYNIGDRVTHNGKVWESTVDGNVWEPGVSSWREVV